jgi:hypothetical protein
VQKRLKTPPRFPVGIAVGPVFRRKKGVFSSENVNILSISLQIMARAEGRDACGNYSALF